MNRTKWVPIAVVAFLVTGMAVAADLAGVSMPDQRTVDGKTLTLNGLGLREASFLKVDVYVGGLYLEEGSSDPKQILDSEQIKHLDMHFIYKKVDRKKITKAWVEGLEANAKSDFDALREPLEKLNGWMEEMIKGDSMSFTARPGAGLEVVVKGELKGVIDDETFAREFWSIFLGPEPPNEGLKQGMLGLD
jgi:hypothetical protein